MHPQYSTASASTASREDEVIFFLEPFKVLAPALTTQKSGSPSNPAPLPEANPPVIPPWGTADSGKRKETEPVASFRVGRSSNSTDIVFEPPMYNFYCRRF
jgi:hypothetical protein